MHQPSYSQTGTTHNSNRDTTTTTPNGLDKQHIQFDSNTTGTNNNMADVHVYRRPKLGELNRGRSFRERASSFTTETLRRTSTLAIATLKLLNFHHLPEWSRDNKYILKGYRPISNSVKECVKSMTFMHNETLNIYTHLIPAIGFLVAQFYIQRIITDRFPEATALDRVVFALNLGAAFITMTLSSLFHTLVCHSEHMCHLWLHIDYVGILALIVGSFFSGIYVGFYCEPGLRTMYWSMIIILSMGAAVCVTHPKLQGLKFRTLRSFAFILTAGSGLAPLAHGVILYGWSEMCLRSGMHWYLLEGLIYGTGAVFFVTRFPESVWPGTFDLILSSHQIFHTLVVFASLAHMYGVWSAYSWNYEHQKTCISMTF